MNEHAKQRQQAFEILLAVVQFLAQRNLGFRGTEENI